MKPSNRLVLGVSLSLIVVVSVLGIVLMSMNSGQLTIEFVPDHLNTIPDDVGWFLVEITTNRELTECDIEIHTNQTVETDYVYWAQTKLIEVFVYPTASNLEQCIEIELTLTSGSMTVKDVALLYVLNWTSCELPYAAEMRDVFVDYLSENCPEFGINETTEWIPIYNTAGILVVTHYLFMSEQWEMEVAWHVMIAPSDWVHVYLRQRCNLEPSWGGEIVSWSTDNKTINEVDPPLEIYRAM
ncbi:hypothetical protein EU527_08605 [Candidatus Thorarchaeota archaeon]|nr:MAG: hypothetical protein EU527_08605 [Candidatus Thorarchaeota archaeon]